MVVIIYSLFHCSFHRIDNIDVDVDEPASRGNLYAPMKQNAQHNHTNRLTIDLV